MKYKVSLDAGNSGLKGIPELDFNSMLNIPNVNSSNAKVNYELQSNLTKSKRKGIDRLDIEITPHYKKKNAKSRSFILGDMANNFTDTRENRQIGDKAKDNQLYENIYVAIAYMLLRHKINKEEKLSKHMMIKTDLATGLPFHEWEIEKNREMFKDNLQGNHLIKFNNPYFTETLGVEEIELIISNVVVFIEGEATLNLVKGDFEGYKPKELDGLNIMNVDFGAYTGEIIGQGFTIEYGEDYDEFTGKGVSELVTETKANLSKGIAKGIGHYMEDAIKEINETIPEVMENHTRLTRRDIELAYMAVGKGADGRFGYLSNPRNVYVGHIVEKHLADYGDYMAKIFISLVNSSNERGNIDKIYLSGGGSHFEPVINSFKEKLIAEGFKSTMLITLDQPDPVFSNALGYYVSYVHLLEELEETKESN